jgi:SagB-type dehydrogenase family enzyme
MLRDPGAVAVRHELSDADGRFTLPAPVPTPATDLDSVLAGRRSRYRFAESPPDAETVSALLRWSLGRQRMARLPDGTCRQMWRAPSAGGLPSLSTYVSVRPGVDIPCGLYEWHRERHDLVRLFAGDPATAWESVLVQPEFARRAPMMLVLAGRLDTTLVKYPARHYRTLHVDAGVALQNLYLVATALGLGGCAVTGFRDQALTDLLGCDESVFPIVVFACGRLPER